VSWPESVADRRMLVFLAITGVVVSGYVVYAVRTAWGKAAAKRERRRPKPTAPVYAGAVPHAYLVALGVGAIRAAEHAEPVDQVDYTRMRECGARETVPRTLRALLGGGAEEPGAEAALVEAVLRQRTAVGPALWMQALAEFATFRGLPYGERQQLLTLAMDIGRAEDRLRMSGLLGPAEIVPSLLACQWADGVHLVRCAMRADWLARPQGLEYLARAGELTAKWYPTWSTVVSAQLLPALLSDDAEELAWRLPVARHLLDDGPSPLRVPLPTTRSSCRRTTR